MVLLLGRMVSLSSSGGWRKAGVDGRRVAGGQLGGYRIIITSAGVADTLLSVMTGGHWACWCWRPSSMLRLGWLCVHRVLLLLSTVGIGVGIVNVDGAVGDSVSGACTTRGAYLSWPSLSTQPFMYVAETKLNPPYIDAVWKESTFICIPRQMLTEQPRITMSLTTPCSECPIGDVHRMLWTFVRWPLALWMTMPGSTSRGVQVQGSTFMIMYA